MLPSHNPVAVVLSDKVLIPLYFEERKSVALSDGTILTSDFDAKKSRKSGIILQRQERLMVAYCLESRLQ